MTKIYLKVIYKHAIKFTGQVIDYYFVLTIFLYLLMFSDITAVFRFAFCQSIPIYMYFMHFADLHSLCCSLPSEQGFIITVLYSSLKIRKFKNILGVKKKVSCSTLLVMLPPRIVTTFIIDCECFHRFSILR